jgi:hypothetical protein
VQLISNKKEIFKPCYIIPFSLPIKTSEGEEEEGVSSIRLTSQPFKKYLVATPIPPDKNFLLYIKTQLITLIT